MAGSGGPWGGSGGGQGPDDEGRREEENRRNGSRRPGEGPQIPEIDEIMRKGQEQLRVLMGGRDRNQGGGNGGGGRNGLPSGPIFTRNGVFLGALALVAGWLFMSLYSVAPEERSVELTLGRASGIGEPGLNFAPWPIVTYEKVQVTGERTTDVGSADGNTGALMLTRDQNIVDIGFQVVWNVTDPEAYLFNIADPEETVRAVSESAMRDIIARSELSPILNRDRGKIPLDLRVAVQATLDEYNAGVQVIRVNLRRAQPPSDVQAAFRAVQDAKQERDRLEKEADGYANKVTAGARGQAAQLVEQAEAYRAKAINSAEGEAARFNAVLAEYVKAPAITRKRLYIETMETVLGGMNKVILDGVSGEGGVLPYLPLDRLGSTAPQGSTTGGSN